MLALLTAAPCLRAQSLFGTILGRITDPAQAAVAGATVRIRNTQTNVLRVVPSDEQGDYQAPTLPVGAYEISCEAKGFRSAIARGITLAVNQRARVDFQLEVGALEQSIEVTTRPPLIETDTASQGTVIDNRRIVQLPLNGRNFQQLAYLAPGVVAPVAGAANFFSVAGTRGHSNSFMMDGASNTNINANVTFISPSIDLIQEFKIQRNTFNAEFGHGAAQINVVTKSGTNQLHFTVFEFLRNDKLQARNFFDLERKPALRRNQFGATVGGPAVIPRLYNGRNKTFWLVNFDATRQRNPATQYAAVPTQAQLDGDLSTISGVVRDPLTNQPFPNNRIPSSRINPTTSRFRQYLPVTDQPLGTYGRGLNYVNAGSGIGDSDQVTVRADHNFTATSSALLRYTFNDDTNINLTILPFYATGGEPQQHNAVLGHNWVLRPTLINEARLGFSRHTLWQGPNYKYDRNMAEFLGLQNLLSRINPAFNSLPAVSIVGYAGFGGPQLITQRVNSWTWLDNLTWIRGPHTFKFGADIRRVMLDIRNIGSPAGSFAFQGQFSGNSLGDFLLGIPRTAGASAPPGPDGVNYSTIWQVFVQDDWKVSSNLTLSLGVRWEYCSPWVNSRDRRSLFDPSFPGGRLIYPGDDRFYVPGKGFTATQRPLAPRGLVPPDKNNLAPRFGFAWRPYGSTRNSVRGSYGVFFEAANGNNDVLFGSFNYPHVLNHNLTNDVTRPLFYWSSLFPSTVAEGSVGFSSLHTEMPIGYVQQWSFNLQREFSATTAVEIGYLGSKGTGLDWRIGANQAKLDADPTRPTSIVSRLPYPAFAPGAGIITRWGLSNYHAFIARLERSFSRGLSFLFSYTASKAIDNSSFAGNIGAQPAQPQNIYDLKSEKGLAYFDVPQRLAATAIWDIPFARGALYPVLGGWQLTAIVQLQAGNPWSVLVAGDPANIGTGNQRAHQVGNPFPDGFEIGGPARLRFDPKAFAVAPRGTFGNTGRNIIRDAPINNWDVGLNKSFQFGEHMRLEFRAEFFNFWNHTQFNQFNNSVDSPTFASWSTARAPRIIQLGLKLTR
jgi:hypothetical protein